MNGPSPWPEGMPAEDVDAARMLAVIRWLEALEPTDEIHGEYLAGSLRRARRIYVRLSTEVA